MFAQRLLSPWTLAIAFALAVVGVLLSHSLLCPPAMPRCTIAGLTERLRRAGLAFDVVPQTDISPEEGVYLCERPQLREQLQWLWRTAQYGDRWRGIVFCEFNKRRLGEIPDEELERWGEYGLRLGPFVFFGDPALLWQIRQALPEL
jgi:hypothetical protein